MSNSRIRQRPRKRRGSHFGLFAAALAGIAVLYWGALSLTKAPANSAIGEPALEHVKDMVAFGPRPPGSEAHSQTQRYIQEKLQAAGWAVEQDPFTAQAPHGPVPMNNIIGRHAGRTDRAIVLAAHYDTKLQNSFRFVGANDGGSGTGLLLALAPILAKQTYDHAIWLVFFDGEEAFRDWSQNDSVYGSRHLAAKLKASGELSRIGALLLVDMIGDRDLDIQRESNSTPWLTDLVCRVAQRLGHERYFLNSSTPIEDDHLPFLQAGVPAVDLIDFNYGPDNRYWHTAEDTLDKISAQSLGIVGEVLLESIAELDRSR
ncbi:MAG: M28 family peptidase [Acidobacteria bacterium]|nr:M28 family peptidase [Acidobacteriota bacterium]